MRVLDTDFDRFLLDKKSNKTYENILNYDILYKNFMGAKSLGIWFKKIDGFIKTYDGIRYLILFDSKRYDAIYNRSRYLISQKSCITNGFLCKNQN